MSIPRLLVAALLFTLMLPLLNCGNGHDADEKYYLVADNIQVPYWQTAHAGFSQAAQELKVRSEFVGPDSFDPKAQQQAFEQVLQSGKPSGILISTADAKLMKDDINKVLNRKANELRSQLSMLGRPAIQRGSRLKGRKVPPKYRSPSGETWAGRGARPRWLVAAIKRGKKIEDFLIKRRRAKR